MAASQRGRRTLREIARHLFMNQLFILTSTMLGFAIALVYSNMEQEAYEARLEVATAGPFTVGQLPTVVELRRALYDPEVLRTLVPAEVAGDPAKVGLLTQIIDRRLTMQSLEDPSRLSTIWRVKLEVPASSPAAAQQQTDAFLKALRQRLQPGAGNPSPGVDKTAQAKAGSDRELPLTDFAIAVNDLTADTASPVQLIADAAPVGLDQALLEARQAMFDAREQAVALGTQQQQLKAAIEQAATDPSQSLPAVLRTLVPETKALAEQIDQGRDQLKLLLERHKPGHPNVLALESALKQAEQKLAAALTKATPSLQAEVTRLADALAAAKKEELAATQRLRDLLQAKREPVPAAAASPVTPAPVTPEAAPTTLPTPAAAPELVKPTMPAPASPLPPANDPPPNLPNAAAPALAEPAPPAALPNAEPGADQPSTPSAESTMPLPLPELPVLPVDPKNGESEIAPEFFALDEEGFPTLASALPSRVPSVKLASQDPVVAGPIIDPNRLRPKVSSNCFIGGAIGLALALILVYLRARSDQRVHVPADLDGLGHAMEVFGALPEVKGPPVRLGGGLGRA